MPDFTLHYSLRVTNSTVAHTDKDDDRRQERKREDEGWEAVSSASVYLNGVRVIDSSQFGNEVSVVQIAVPLLAANKIAVEVDGPAGGQVTVEIIEGMVGSFTAFPTKTYKARDRDDRPVVSTFSVADPSAQFVLHVTNAALRPESHRDGSGGRREQDDRSRDDDQNQVSRATIAINGVVVVRPEQFGRIVSSLEVPVLLSTSNQLSVQTADGPGSKVTVEIAGNVTGLFPVFGVKRYEAREDESKPSIDSFNVLDPTAPYLLLISTGRSDDHDRRDHDGDRHDGDDDGSTSQAIVTINGVRVVDVDDIHLGASLLEIPVSLLQSNEIKAIVRGREKSTVSIEIVGIETAPPSIVATASPSADSYGWNNTPVTVSFACSSVVSGIASCSAPVTVAKEGADQVLSGTAVDKAGNTAVASVVVSLDETAPAIAGSASPFANQAGWNNTPVTVNYACTDSLSGIANCPSAVLVTSEGAGQVISGTAMDKAGNAASASVKLNVDRTAPVISASTLPTANANGWNTSDVTITFLCSDTISGVASCPVAATATSEGAKQVFTGAATDIAGNSASTSIILNIEKTPPTISASAMPPANAAGWNNTDVTIMFQCGTSISGGIICPAPQTLGREGAKQAVTGTVSDTAGNSSSATAVLNIDKTPPTITPALFPRPNAAGWNNTAVTVNFACSDSLSGIATCSGPQQFDAEVAGQAISGTATDIAGNSASTSVTVNIDRTPPIITVSVSPQPNAAGWNNTDVTVTFHCSDTASGIASCPPAQVVSAEGANQLITGVATDIAGNTSATSVTLNIAKTPPSIIASAAPPANAAGWNNTDVTVTFQCSSSASGAPIASCSSPVTVSTEGLQQAVTGTVVDVAGNTAQATLTLNIDKSPPGISAVPTPPPNAAGWNKTDVVVAFTCSDALSGVASCPSQTTVSSEGAAIPVSGTATDKAGNSAQASLTLKIDKTPPVVTISSPAANAVVRNSQLTISGTATDTLSGIAAATCNGVAATVATNGAVSCTATLVSGPNTVTIAAVDTAGNTASAQVPVAFVSPPVANAGLGYSGVPGTPIAFSAAASTDPDNSPLTFAWDFGDGSTGSGVTVMHSYSQAGTYTVKLLLTDQHGGMAQAITTATVVQPDLPPIVSAGGPYSGLAGSSIAFAGSGSSPVSNPLTFTWAFGDGTFGSGTSTSHTYKLPGTYTATLTASDGQLTATSNVFITVTQANRPPIVNAGGPYSGVTGTPVSFVATGTDPDNDPVTFAWDFGDGGIASGASVNHTFSLPGNYTVKVTGNDGRGGLTIATANAAIAQANRPPHANPGGPYNGQAKTRILFSGSGSSDPDNDPLTYSWDFGDGSSGSGVTPNHGYGSAGNYSVTLTVDDGRGGKDTATTSVTVSTAVATPNQPPVARPGGPYAGEAGSVITFNGSASSDPDGDALTFSWDLGDGTKATGTAPTHIYAAPGTYTVSMSVDDGNGNASTAATMAVIAPAADHIPPQIALSAPSKVLPGATVTITASATDNVGVASVTFDVDGAASNTVTTPPYQRIINVPSVAAPGAIINVRATAADAAGNTAVALATLTIDATPETQAPTVTINTPAAASPGSVVILTANATDAVGVASVTFSAAGSQIATVPTAPYESTYPVPTTAAVGSTIQFMAHATNFSGNSSDATAVVNIVQQGAAANPPAVTVSAPPSVTAGMPLSLSATATSDTEVSMVSFFVEGERIATLVQAPYVASFTVAQGAIPGSILHIEVRADDFNGNEGIATAQTVVAAAQKAIVIGQVLDDSSGLLLSGATVSLTGTDVTGAAYTQTTETDERGRFEIHAPAGMGVLVISQNGMTRADRLINLQSGTTTKALDARLTPLAPPSGPVSGVLGGALSGDAGTLTVPAGAAPGSATYTLTTISQQAIQGTLPPGWSPVSSIDIAPHGVSIAGATLTVPNPLQYAAGTALTVAKWDEGASAWRALGTGIVSADASSIQGPADGTGQYSVLATDTQPSSPSVPMPGDILTGVTNALVPPDALSLVVPKPKIIIYSPGVNSDVAGSFTSNLPLPSGTVLSSVITESYQFFSGAQINPEPFTIDLVAYQSTPDGKQHSATYKVSPSQTFEPLTLQSGTIDVQLLAPTAATTPISSVGSSGATLTSPTNESIQLPPGAVQDAIAVQIIGLSASDLGMLMPQGVDFLGGMRLDFVGTLALPARVSIPTPASLGDTSGILLVRLQEMQGQTRMVLVGVGNVAGDHITSDVSLPGATKTLEGVRTAGRYVFVHMQALTGFAAGTVIGADGNPFLGAVVSNPAVPIVSLSRGIDGYVAVGGLGQATFTAQDLSGSGLATGTVVFANENDVQPLDLTLVKQPLTVRSIVPSDGTTSVSLDTAVVITFSQGIDPNGASGANAASIQLTAPDGSVVGSSLGFSAANSVVTLRPNASLQPDTAYTVTIVGTVANIFGDQLGTPAKAIFTSLDTRAPPPPPAGSITAGIPTNGQSTITATQGTAGLHDTVTIINFTTGQVTPVLVQADGSFSTNVAASLTDKLQIKISNGSGNDTTVNLPRFSQTNSDGSVSAAIDSTGGHIDGPGGTAVDIPAGSLPDGTVVSIQQVSEADFPITLTDAQKQLFSYSGGIALDFAGATPAKYVNVSIPPGPNDSDTDQWVVNQVVTIAGTQQLAVVDTAHIISGRITTSSPPCPGVAAAATYGFFRSKRPLGIGYGQLPPSYVAQISQLDITNNVGLPWVSFVPQVPAIVCLPVLTGNVTLSSNTVKFSIPSSLLTPQDREILITNTTNNTDYHYPRDVIEYSFNVLGDAGDNYRVTITTPDGKTNVLTGKSFTVSQATPGTVDVTLNADKINVAIQKVEILDLTTIPSPPPPGTPCDTTTSSCFTFTDSNVSLNFDVPGAATDTYKVQAINIDTTVKPRTLNILPIGPPAPLNAGNLVARAVTGTIDPPSAGRTGVYLSDATSGPDSSSPCTFSQCIQVPDAQIINGGFAFSLNGDVTDQWYVTVTYSDGKIDSESLPLYRLVVQSATTGEVLHTIINQSPARGQKLNIGVITEDTTTPMIIGSPGKTNGFDPSAPLTVTFSQPMDPDSLASNFVLEAFSPSAGWTEVDGTVQVSSDDLSATFVPTTGLLMGTQYRLRFTGVRGLNGQVIGNADDIVLTTFHLEHLCPGQTNASCPVTFPPGIDPLTGQRFNLIDVASWRKQDPATQQINTYLAAISDGKSDVNLFTFDATDPTNPSQLAQVFTAGRMQRIAVNPGVQFGVQILGSDAQGNRIPWPCRGVTDSTLTFTGDLAITTTNNPFYNFVEFWDVTDPKNICDLGGKILTASSQVPPINAFGTVRGDGLARRVATLSYPNGMVAYIAVGQIGLMSVDVGKNSPSVDEHTRQLEPYFAGDFQDVVAMDNQLLAIEQNSGTAPGNLDVFDASLNEVTSYALTDSPVSLAYAEALPVDFNHDGIITADEVRNIAFVGSFRMTSPNQAINVIHYIDVTDPTSPQEIGSVQMPGIIRGIYVDVRNRRLYVRGGTTQFDNGNLFAVDISDLTLSGLSTNNGNPNGWDDRVIGQISYPAVNGFSIDPNLGLAFVASPYLGLDVVPTRDVCCDLAVDLIQEHPEGNPGKEDQTEQDEKQAILTGLRQGLDNAQTKCTVNPRSQPDTPHQGVSILEQGSGACIWKGDCTPPKDPSAPPSDQGQGSIDDQPESNYQPGISDHDFEVFIPQQNFSGNVQNPDWTPDTNDPNVPQFVTPAQCLAILLNDQFTDPSTGAPIRIVVNNRPVSFEDISFFPVKKEEFLNARLNIDLPKSAGSDPYGDLGLGRQQLLLKWLLEGVYVPVTLSDNSVIKDEPDENLQTVLQTLQSSPTPIPALEGLEWAILQKFNLAKSGGFIRIQGADQENWTFHGLFDKQIHDAGKAGIRTALAQMVAVPFANSKIISTSKGVYDSVACVKPLVSNALPGNIGDWSRDGLNLKLGKCYSFEEYIASMAVLDADEGALFGFGHVFTPVQAQQVYRFFRIKANRTKGTDDSDILKSEVKAEDFIASVAQFIDGVQNDPRTIAAYNVGINGDGSTDPPTPPDPLASQRTKNRDYGLQAIETKLSQGNIPAKRSKDAGIHVFNDGSADTEGIFVRMYRDTPSGGVVEALKSSAVDLPGSHADGYQQWLDFSIGTKDATNPFINQGPSAASQSPADPNVHPVTFLVDLPDRSVKEANRQNNYAGFYYWILDRSIPNGPSITHTIPTTVSNGYPPFPLDQKLLKPDPVCAPVPLVTISQMVSNAGVTITVSNPTDTDLVHVKVCTNLGPQPDNCTFVNVPAHGKASATLSLGVQSNTATVISTATATATDSDGNTIPIRASEVVANIQSPIQIAFYDATPLSDANHPFSRHALSHVGVCTTAGPCSEADVPIRGATTDGTLNAVRVVVSGLQPGQSALVQLVDSQLPSVVDGLGQLTFGNQNTQNVSNISITPDGQGSATLNYTPPAFFLRPSAQKSDWGKAERTVNIVVHQENVGTTVQTLTLQRPPVFLLHGLGGQIDAFDNFQPLVSAVCTDQLFCKQQSPPAQYYVPRAGFDGRFDLFNIGSDRTSHTVAYETSVVRAQIAQSLNGTNAAPYLPGFAIGKIDVIAHSMGGVIMRNLTQDPVIAGSIRKLIVMNSPLAGTPLADKIVSVRDDFAANIFPQFRAIKVDPLNPSDAISKTVDALRKVATCSTIVKGIGRSSFFNIYDGAVDDLQTTAAVAYANTVPTHHLVTRTANADIAGTDSGEVWWLWRALGFLCNWTPDASTVNRTTQLNATTEIGITLATAGIGIAADGGVTLNVPKQSTFLRGLRSEIKAAKGGLVELKQIFSSDNDRIVPLSSQLEGLPTTDPSVTYLSALIDHGGQQISSDHQQAKITSGVRVRDCVIQDANGVPQFNVHAGGFQDLNNDGTPDVVCHVLKVLEADPKESLFRQP